MDIASLDLIFLLLLEKYAMNWVVIVKNITIYRWQEILHKLTFLANKRKQDKSYRGLKLEIEIKCTLRSVEIR